MILNPGKLGSWRGRETASVLIVVLWVAFGLVSLALYFAHAMSMELRASDNRVAALEADQAIAGAARYAAYVLANAAEAGESPDPLAYQREAVPVGEASFWFIGRDPRSEPRSLPVFGLVDESSKLNLNTATREMLELLPRMTPEIAAAIIDWRDADDTVTEGGAEDETYLRRNPPYRCKNGRFESVEELRLVSGITLEILYGEDANQNGILDANENDGDASWPPDNRDGRLDPGLVEYLTVSTREPAVDADGNARIDVSTAQGRQQLAPVLADEFGPARANEILGRLGNGPLGSVLEFYQASGMTAVEFERIEARVMTPTPGNGEGLVNVNTAPEAVLVCLPGVGVSGAASLVARRLSNRTDTRTLAWVTEVLTDAAAIRAAGPWITGRGYQFAADVAAVGRHGRGYRRARFIVDLSEGTPAVRLRRDLSDLGWALGVETRQNLPAIASRNREISGPTF